MRGWKDRFLLQKSMATVSDRELTIALWSVLSNQIENLSQGFFQVKNI